MVAAAVYAEGEVAHCCSPAAAFTITQELRQSKPQWLVVAVRAGAPTALSAIIGVELRTRTSRAVARKRM